ncbi:MAG: orotidine 5''-phosphate decarboxylase, subfamily 2 [Candidatus Peregrinibacteria bacterium Gr01-1014_25]|nr:MAG: orotidine 5''-phosphate decarboxylase, subfamily 2 [Candidatus Peregrinibacteria bacterium Gr01-1014_25]
MTSSHFADRLQARIADTSPVCVGLDPQIRKLPSGLDHSPEGVAQFCHGIIDATHDIAACVKPNLAFFELLGWEGMKIFWDICAYAQSKKLLVIADGKRGDIGSTAEAYAEGYLHENAAVDALTVHPYHGSDGIRPFIDVAARNGKGVYVLVKTSNASAGELQDLPCGDEAVHEHLAQLVESWGAAHFGPKTNLSCVGAVVGATYPEELKYLRTLMPHCPFLIPGYGAQGGTAADVARGFIPDGTGAVVSASRSIIQASGGSDWQDAARKAAETMAAELRKVLSA